MAIPYRKLFHNTELRTRFVSALLLMGVAIVPVLIGGWSFVCALGVLSIFLVKEWIYIARAEEDIIFTIVLAAAILLALFTFLFFGARAAFASAVFSCLVGLTFSSLHKRELMFVFWLGLWTLPFSLLSMSVIRYHEEGLSLFFLLVLTITATDTAGYFVGKTLQGPKIFPRFSPNKTWSGTLGGIGSAALLCGVYGYFFLPAWSLPFLILTAIALSISSQLGDLTISIIKRHNKMKDTGTIIPGHGGFFDRFDGYIFAPSILAFLIHFQEDLLL